MCAVPPGTAASIRAPRLELATIFRRDGPAYRRTHVLARAQVRAMRAIETCRTSVLGGHREMCDRCGATRLVYHSCRNRHCPKCQTVAKERWLAARRADLLPIPYFHVVFTLPHSLNALAQGNPRVLYAALFRAAADTLLTFGRDPRWLGGVLGVTAILHTWGQNLSQHLHLHCVVTGGALALDGSHWIRSHPRYLFPVAALGEVFRGKYLEALQAAYTAGRLTFAAGTEDLRAAPAFARWLASLRGQPWVVYAKRPFAGPTQVLEYVGRYTHRVALTNSRLVSADRGLVRFRWKDYADHSAVKTMALTVDEFIRRFLLHVVPDGFMRIRHFGLLANRIRRRSLARSRELLHQPSPVPPSPVDPGPAQLSPPTGVLARCPVCREGRMRASGFVAPAADPEVLDTS